MYNNFKAAIAVLAVAMAVPASAVTIDFGSFSGGFSRGIENESNASGSINDVFKFSIAPGISGTAEGNVSSFSSTLSVRNIILTSVTLDGIAYNQDSTGNLELWTLSRAIGAGVHTINVVGTWGPSGGSYGGNVDFTVSAAPEPATWGMMIAGFGIAGAALRRRRRENVRVTYA